MAPAEGIGRNMAEGSGPATGHLKPVIDETPEMPPGRPGQMAAVDRRLLSREPPRRYAGASVRFDNSITQTRHSVSGQLRKFELAHYLRPEGLAR
jgi:hypothetical protein